MVDYITDTHNLIITIIQHGNLQISNVVAPSEVFENEEFVISYDVTNNGGTDTCWGHIMDTGQQVEIPNSKWQQAIPAGELQHFDTTVPGRSEDLHATIEVGYYTE